MSRDGAQGSAVAAAPTKRPLGSSGVKKLSSSNPLVRRRMQLVEKWQKSREKDEESDEVSFSCPFYGDTFRLHTAFGMLDSRRHL